MPVSVRTLTDKRQTGQEMTRLVRDYAQDLQQLRNAQGVPLADLSLPQFFNFVRQIQYRQDRQGVEIVTRPWHSLSTSWRQGLDCKKKAILIASWLQLRGIPWRFVAVSSRPDRDIHHVIVEAWQGGSWKEIDATYPQNSLGISKNWTAKETLSGARGRFSADPVLVSISGEGQPDPETDRQFLIVRERIQAATMGVEPASTAAGVVAIVAAILAAVTSVTVAIVSAVADKNRQERQFAFEAQKVVTQGQLAEQAAARAAAERQAEADRQKETLIKFILPATAVAGGIILFAGGKKHV